MTSHTQITVIIIPSPHPLELPHLVRNGHLEELLPGSTDMGFAKFYVSTSCWARWTWRSGSTNLKEAFAGHYAISWVHWLGLLGHWWIWNKNHRTYERSEVPQSLTKHPQNSRMVLSFQLMLIVSKTIFSGSPLIRLFPMVRWEIAGSLFLWLCSQSESNTQVKYPRIFCHQTYEPMRGSICKIAYILSRGIFKILGSQTCETRLQLLESLQ